MPTSWLPKLLIVEDFDHDWKKHDEAVYRKFQDDLIKTNPNFKLKRFSLNKSQMLEGRERIFWHLVTEGNVEDENRTIDPRRCERIGWIKPVVEEYPQSRIYIWSNTRTRKQGGQDKRYVLSATDFSYVVILSDKGTYALLITMYFVENDNRKETFRREFEEWKKAGAAL